MLFTIVVLVVVLLVVSRLAYWNDQRVANAIGRSLVEGAMEKGAAREVWEALAWTKAFSWKRAFIVDMSTTCSKLAQVHASRKLDSSGDCFFCLNISLFMWSRTAKWKQCFVDSLCRCCTTSKTTSAFDTAGFAQAWCLEGLLTVCSSLASGSRKHTS